MIPVQNVGPPPPPLPGNFSVTPPSDSQLKQTIEQIAKQCVSSPAFEEVLRNAAATDKQALLRGKEFVADQSAEGHQYFRWCVDNIRRQNSQMQTGQQQSLPFNVPHMTPSQSSMLSPFGQQIQSPFFQQHSSNSHFSVSVSDFKFPDLSDIVSLINKHQEPSAPNDSDVAIVTATAAGTLTSLLTPLLPSLSLSTSLDHWIETIWRISPETLQSLIQTDTPSTKAWCLKKAVEASSDFWGRMARVVVLYRLMSLDYSIRFALLPYLLWMLRLTYIVALDDSQKVLVLTLLKKAKDHDGLINSEKYNEYGALITTKVLPGVEPSYNLESKRRSRFDLSSPCGTHSPKRQKQSEQISSPAEPSPSLLVPIQFQEPSVMHSGQLPMVAAPVQWPASIPPAPPGVPPFMLNDPNLDPEKIPVGVLATMLKQISKRARNIQAAFVPYRPLDPLLTPATFPPAQMLNEYLIDRLNDLHDDIELQFKAIQQDESRRGDSYMASRGRLAAYDEVATDPDYDYGKPQKKEKKRRPPREFRDGGGLKSMNEANWEKPLAWAQEEMGIADDGTVLDDHIDLGSGRLGIGAGKKTSVAEDLYDDYRRNRAKRYHQTIAAAQAARGEDEKLCYICQKAGHFARECKFGLT